MESVARAPAREECDSRARLRGTASPRRRAPARSHADRSSAGSGRRTSSASSLGTGSVARRSMMTAAHRCPNPTWAVSCASVHSGYSRLRASWSHGKHGARYSWSARRPSSGGTGSWSPGSGPGRIGFQGGWLSTRRSGAWFSASPGRTLVGLQAHPGQASRPGHPALRDVHRNNPSSGRTLSRSSKRTDVGPVRSLPCLRHPSTSAVRTHLRSVSAETLTLLDIEMMAGPLARSAPVAESVRGVLQRQAQETAPRPRAARLDARGPSADR